jgi:urea carboxylase
MTFDTLLIANRGEIALRILRTASALGLRTVAVFSDSDRGAPHVAMADEAIHIGATPARESYLRGDRILESAASAGAGAIHPGYGLLSEDAAFATAVEAAGMRFVGPAPPQIELFGSKDRARELAREAGVPIMAGSGVLADPAAAAQAAAQVGYPVMLKAAGGGGGIGMEPCHDEATLRDAFERVGRLATASFGAGGIFLERFVERARHVEVQVFGDGAGRVIALGDRDCTLQRRNQKVVEEAPAPDLPAEVHERLARSATALCATARYRSAGTVEFLYDAQRGEASFLEVNARLQVEHPVTEAIFGIDLVGWMLRLAQDDLSMFDEAPPVARGHAVEARVYAEDPAAGHLPSAGLLTEVAFPDDLRVDGWVRAGTEISTAYDPLLAKLVATGDTRKEAVARLAAGLERSRIGGIRTNIGLLRAALDAPAFRDARHSTATLTSISDEQPRIEVMRAGRMTTVQDWPGRIGLWSVGVPPSGAIDDRSFRAGNRALGNAEGDAGLECTIDGPTLRFSAATTVCVCGAEAPVTLDGVPVSRWEPIAVPAGGVLDVGTIAGLGLRAYVLITGGLDVPDYLGSAATFTLGTFGGHGGRALRGGDVLTSCSAPGNAAAPGSVPVSERSPLTNTWEIAVVEGPHAAPEFFTLADIETFYEHRWEVHFNSDRTGIRLVGPRPVWARSDGGDAGLHPSNIHDTPYSVGAVDFTGDVPILLGPDGPSLGGFVCPATVITGERWKLGQLRPGDTVRFVAVGEHDAAAMRVVPRVTRNGRAPKRLPSKAHDNGVLGRLPAGDETPKVTYRRSGDDNLLVEYGPMVLDLGLRMRVHALAERLAADVLDGVVDLTPGIRSLQIHVDPDRLTVRRLLEIVRSVEGELPVTHELAVPSRIVHLPLSWDDPATREATDRYISGVRSDAPWCPWNIEFIRRVNGLQSVDDVRRIVFDADYLVLGLGDVYLGAPVATPLDPRHRLVTTKYNPARTWTPENAVGIGGAYLCIYGMEGPGGYQFVGRTTQVWSRYRTDSPFKPGSPWLLRFFDRIRWHPVGAEELLQQRADLAAGRLPIEIEEGSFTLAEHMAFVEREAEGIAAFRSLQSAAFGAERTAWAAAGEFDPRPEPSAPSIDGHGPAFDVPSGGAVVEAPLSASIWRVEVRAGDVVRTGQRLLTLEAMKMETPVDSPLDGEVVEVLVKAGEEIVSGAALVVLMGRGTG